MKIIITGGAGFIGSNAAARYLRRGARVVVVDDLSRKGTDLNLKWLQSLGGDFTLIRQDIAQAEPMVRAFAPHADADAVLHLAGQVAVTSSVKDPRDDFNCNALGTFNVLEAMRLNQMRAAIVYASTNKVYGGMEDVGIAEIDGRYKYASLPHGVNEERQLDFHSPYGCSKGSADQYVRDYSRIFGIRGVVFRQSCIYGYRQLGVEDQGWVAWFIIASILGKPIKLYGDGKQVRDVLFIDDLLDAYEAAIARIERVTRGVFNVGGGADNSISLLDLLAYLERKAGKPIPVDMLPWRPGDQRCFISDNRKAGRELGWSPRISWQQGLDLLFEWVASHRELFQ